MRARPGAFRLIILLFGGFVLLQAASAGALFALKLGFGPTQVEGYYLGAALARPRTLAGLLEVAVPHLLAVPLTLFIVIHLVSWAGVQRPIALRSLARLSFVFAIVDIGAGFGVRFHWPGLPLTKLVAFFGLESVLMLWTALLVTAFWPRTALGFGRTPGVMSLDLLAPQCSALVTALRMSEREAAWLRAIGLGEGVAVTVLRKASVGGPLHVRVSGGAELAVDRELARNVELGPFREQATS